MTRAGRRAGAALLAATLLLVACTNGGDADDPRPTPAVTASPATVADEAGALRLRLEAAFGWHAYLLTDVARTRGRVARAGRRALEDSAGAVAAAVADATGADEGSQGRLGRALTAADAAIVAPRAGDARLQRAVGGLARVVAEVVGGPLDETSARDLLTAPVDALHDHAVAFADGDHQQAYERAREGYAALFTAGGTVAAAVVEDRPDEYPGPRSSGALELQSAVRQLLGEHALLTVCVTRRSTTSARDFADAAAALNGNTADLLTAVESAYDTSMAAFGAQWRDRISLLADHAAALGDERPAVARRAQRQVARAAPRIAEVLSPDEGEDTDAVLLRRSVDALDDALLGQSRVFAARRLSAATQRTQRAYESALSFADLVAESVVAQRPEAFPRQ